MAKIINILNMMHCGKPYFFTVTTCRKIDFVQYFAKYDTCDMKKLFFTVLEKTQKYGVKITKQYIYRKKTTKVKSKNAQYY